jgi:hypothetical protein
MWYLYAFCTVVNGPLESVRIFVPSFKKKKVITFYPQLIFFETSPIIDECFKKCLVLT